VRDEALWLPDWRDEDWNLLFGFMDIRNVLSGDALIRRGEPDRTLYFVLRGELEVMVQSSDGLTMGRVARVGAGAVLGELAFFDGGPRSATAWGSPRVRSPRCRRTNMPPSSWRALSLRAPCFSRSAEFLRPDCAELTPSLSGEAATAVAGSCASLLGVLEFRSVLGSAGRIPSAVGMRPRAGQLAAINDEIFVADRPPVEEALKNFSCSGGVSGLRR
jgi:Cyclic nucleotide-binding domain